MIYLETLEDQIILPEMSLVRLIGYTKTEILRRNYDLIFKENELGKVIEKEEFATELLMKLEVKYALQMSKM